MITKCSYTNTSLSAQSLIIILVKIGELTIGIEYLSVFVDFLKTVIGKKQFTFNKEKIRKKIAEK